MGERVGHRRNSKGQKLSGVNSKGKSFVVGGLFWRNGRRVGFGLSGGGRGNKGNEFGAFFLEIGGSGSCLSLERGGAHVRREGAWGGVDVSNPGATTHRFRFYGPVEVKLELNDRVHADAGGLSSVEAIDLPGGFIKRIAACIFFPDGSVGIFSPLIAVTVAFPKSGFFGGGKVVKVAAELVRGGGGTWIIIAEEFTCDGGEAEKTENRASEQEPVHRRIVGSGWGGTMRKLEVREGKGRVESGRVAERFNVPDSKSGVGVTLPWVQIPPRPRPRGRGKFQLARGERRLGQGQV